MPVKGLLKGLRYFSHIFENEKEEEIQIGLPTDVKHIAHIGMDGPSANTPSWMKKYPNAESSPASPHGVSEGEGVVPSNITVPRRATSAPLGSPKSPTKPKHSRRNHSSSSSIASEDEDSFHLRKPRRHKNSGDSDSPSTERVRRSKNNNDVDSPPPTRTRRLLKKLGPDSPSDTPPRAPKTSRRKKSKESADGGSIRSSKSKAPENSQPEMNNNEVRPNNVNNEGNECAELSKGIRAL